MTVKAYIEYDQKNGTMFPSLLEINDQEIHDVDSVEISHSFLNGYNTAELKIYFTYGGILTIPYVELTIRDTTVVPPEEEKTMSLNELAKEVHQLAVNNGWWNDADLKIVPEKLALIHSEVSEALEEYRNGKPLDSSYLGTFGKPEGFGIELADTIIRIMDLSAWLGLDLDELVAQKHEYNKQRSYRHGGKLA